MLSRKLIIIMCLTVIGQMIFAQDNRRYVALSLVNLSHRNPQLDEINTAANLGMNAVVMSIRKDVIVGKKVSVTNPWQQYDDQIATARKRGMKLGIRIVFTTWCNNRTIGEALNNNVPTCSGFDASERMLGFDTKGVARVHQQSFGYTGCDVYDDCGQMMTTSLSSPRTIKEMQDFTTEVVQRYKSVIDAGDVIYISAVMTPEQEFGFPFSTTKGNDGYVFSLYDYSQSMILGFRGWLKTRYNNDFTKLKKEWGNFGNSFTGFDNLEPPKPNGLFNWTVFILGQAGYDWYSYRQKLLKDYSMTFLKTVKALNPKLNVINDYGSVIDQITVSRGTFAFKDIGEGTDGVKINSSPSQDHRFVMDLARTNFPDKMIMSEVESTAEGTLLQEQQFKEAFAHGAKLVSTFAFDVINNQSHRDFLQRMTNKYINGNQQVEKVETCGTVISNAYELLEDGGCPMNRNNPQNDCRVYREWLNLRKNNGDKPIKVFSDEGFVTGIPFKLNPKDVSSCGSVQNFKEIYSTDCQKVGSKAKANENLKGMIETVSCEKVTGWALNIKNLDEIQTVDIYVDSIKVGTTQANVGNRLDLITTFNSSKANFRGFSFILPDSVWYKSGQAKRIYARFANTSTLLEDSGDLKIIACDGRGSGTCGANYRLIVSPDSLPNVLSRAAEYKIVVSSNAKWSITKNANWLLTNDDSGLYNGGFNLKMTANPDTGSRKGRVTLKAGDLTRNISVTQKGVGQPYLTVSPDSISTIASNGAEFKIAAGSNVKTNISKNVKWIISDPESEVTNNLFGLKIEANPDTFTRKGRLTLTGQGIKKVFYITQKGKGQPCVGCNGSVDTDKPTGDPNEIFGRIAPQTYRGWVEVADCCSIKGWAFDAQNYDEILAVDIYLDKQKIGSTFANLGYRTDVASTYQSNKLLYKSFCFQVPKSTLDSFKNGKNKQLSVRFGGTITKLYSPENRTLICNPSMVCNNGQNCEETVYQDYLETVFPNPSKDIFNLYLYAIQNQVATLKLVNPQGIVLKTLQYDVVGGLNHIVLNTDDIQSGSLLLSVLLENGNFLFKRLIKLE